MSAQTNACQCYGVINDPERKARFAGVFPDDHVPLKHPLLAGIGRTNGQTYAYYEVDVSRMTQRQKKLLARRLAPVFNLGEREVFEDLNNPAAAIPLKSEGVTVCWCSLHSRLAMAADNGLADTEDDLEDEADYDIYDEEFEDSYADLVGPGGD